MLEHEREADLKDLFLKRAFCLKLPTWQISMSSGVTLPGQGALCAEGEERRQGGGS